MTNLLPDGLSRRYCADWMFVGKECMAGWSLCSGLYCRFDTIREAGNKAMIADHVSSTDGLFFNENDVRSLTAPAHKAKLRRGPPGTN